jgi:predicted membrane chloride channel (bestrophin family)
MTPPPLPSLSEFAAFSARRRRQAPRRRALKLLKVLALVGAIGLAKLAVHRLGLELIQVNPLFTSLVASTVFLLGFLLNGVLSDFKESERLPGELATGLEVLSLEIQAIPAHNPRAAVEPQLTALAAFADALLAWLLERLSTRELLVQFHQCHAATVEAAVLLAGNATLQARLMAEMAGVLKIINRIDTIRQTSFLPLVYWLAYASTALLCTGLVFMATTTILEAIFFIFVIAFLLIFLIRLIADIDNPFGFSDANSAEDVALEVLVQAMERLVAIRDAARFASMG